VRSAGNPITIGVPDAEPPALPPLWLLLDVLQAAPIKATVTASANALRIIPSTSRSGSA